MSWFSGLLFFVLEGHCIAYFGKWRIFHAYRYIVYNVSSIHTIYHRVWSVSYSFPFLGHILSADSGSVSEECKRHSLSLSLFWPLPQRKRKWNTVAFTQRKQLDPFLHSPQSISLPQMTRRPISGLKHTTVRLESMQQRWESFIKALNKRSKELENCFEVTTRHIRACFFNSLSWAN